MRKLLASPTVAAWLKRMGAGVVLAVLVWLVCRYFYMNPSLPGLILASCAVTAILGLMADTGPGWTPPPAPQVEEVFEPNTSSEGRMGMLRRLCLDATENRRKNTAVRPSSVALQGVLRSIAEHRVRRNLGLAPGEEVSTDLLARALPSDLTAYLSSPAPAALTDRTLNHFVDQIEAL